ncbi:MAG TPA: phosphomannomutase [Devosia sp.]
MSRAPVELKFGTSGLRGLGKDLDRMTCHAYVGAFLAMLEERGERLETVCIGFDLRDTSFAIALYCAEAVAARGLGVINAGPVPTPALARYALNRRLPALMITASHNPPEHNGIKFYRPDGELAKADEAPIKALLDANHPELQPLTPPPLTADVAREYVRSYAELFGSRALAGLRLGIDQHSAVGRDLLVDILQSLGAQCTVTRRSAEFVAVDTEAVAAGYLDMAKTWLQAGAFDAIVSTDGDGDRPLVIDRDGQQVLGDSLGILAARFLGFTRVVTPVSSTSAVEGSRFFDTVSRTRIGSPYVIEAMNTLAAEGSAVAGFEGNGGFLTEGVHLWRDRLVPALPTRDAVLPIVAVLSAAAEAGVPVADLVAELPARAKATGRISDVDTVRSAQWIDGLVATPHRLQALKNTAEIQTVDGAKFMLDDGNSLHLRLSGNAPELRVYVETSTPASAQILLQNVIAEARDALM